MRLYQRWFSADSSACCFDSPAAMRSAIAGTYGADFWISIGLLLAFLVPTLLLGLVLRRPLVSFNRGLVDAMASTKLM